MGRTKVTSRKATGGLAPRMGSTPDWDIPGNVKRWYITVFGDTNVGKTSLMTYFLIHYSK